MEGTDIFQWAKDAGLGGIMLAGWWLFLKHLKATTETFSSTIEKQAEAFSATIERQEDRHAAQTKTISDSYEKSIREVVGQVQRRSA